MTLKQQIIEMSREMSDVDAVNLNNGMLNYDLLYFPPNVPATSHGSEWLQHYAGLWYSITDYAEAESIHIDLNNDPLVAVLTGTRADGSRLVRK